MQETRVPSLAQGDPRKEGMKTRSSVLLAWRTPWTRSLAGYSPRGRKESDMTEHARGLIPDLSSCLLDRLCSENSGPPAQMGPGYLKNNSGRVSEVQGCLRRRPNKSADSAWAPEGCTAVSAAGKVALSPRLFPEM